MNFVLTTKNLVLPTNAENSKKMEKSLKLEKNSNKKSLVGETDKKYQLYRPMIYFYKLKIFLLINKIV